MKQSACFTLIACAIFGIEVQAQSGAAPAVPQDHAAAATSTNGNSPTPKIGQSTKDSPSLESIEHPLAYPPEAREKGIQGKVIVKVSISETGTVESVEPVSGDSLLTKAAVEAVKHWKFKPFIKNGKAIRVLTNLPVNFALPDKTDSTMVELAKIVRPVYPKRAEQEEIQGQAVVRAFVNETGDVEKAEVADSTDPVFNRSALEAVKQWKFKPFIAQGKPIPVAVKVPVDFAFSDKIDDESALREKYPREQPVRGDGPKPVPLETGITRLHCIHKVEPIYPWQAKNTHIQGLVELRAVIGKEGRIENLQLVSGDQALVKSAIGAVRQWRYEPFLVKGEPIQVNTIIDVHFMLGAR